MKSFEDNYTYVKMNDEPVIIEAVEDEHDGSKDFHLSFWWNNQRYYLEDFVRCHNNPWIFDNYPAYIHAYEEENYYNPIYIELIGGSAVNIYELRLWEFAATE